MSVFIGVDVGTGSARAGVFDAAGTLLASHARDIAMWRAPGDIAEQSSDDIWQAVCTCIRAAVAEAGVAPDSVQGLGFDAACSMVVLDGRFQPLSISTGGEAHRNVIVWMDHRAAGQAARINAQGHSVLDYVGGRISPEMQTPKLLWLAETLPQTYATAGHFLDLSDFLTWAATGSLARSGCTVTCKWTYLAHENRWDDSFFRQIGLSDLPDGGYARIGQTIVAPGTALGQGLTDTAARQMGLRPGTPVGAGLIDAHAGGLATVGADPEAGPEATMAYVFGTSACTMASARDPRKVPGIWGPYLSAMVPGLWLLEGGQSAAGEAIAQLIRTHPAQSEAQARAEAAGMSLNAYLVQEVTRLCPQISEATALAGNRLIVPDFLGNRAPHADPAATAVVSGLTLAADLPDLLATYVAGVYGVGYGLRQIMAAQAAQGVTPGAIVISGGAGRSDAVRQMLADASGTPILAPRSPEPVLLGAAMLGAVAGGGHADLREAMTAMSQISARFLPAGGDIARCHAARFAAFESLQAVEQGLRRSLDAIG